MSEGWLVSTWQINLDNYLNLRHMVYCHNGALPRILALLGTCHMTLLGCIIHLLNGNHKTLYVGLLCTWSEIMPVWADLHYLCLYQKIKWTYAEIPLRVPVGHSAAIILCPKTALDNKCLEGRNYILPIFVFSVPSSVLSSELMISLLNYM